MEKGESGGATLKPNTLRINKADRIKSQKREKGESRVGRESRGGRESQQYTNTKQYLPFYFTPLDCAVGGK